MFQERVAKLSSLKPVTFTYNNQFYTITFYQQLENLMAEAVAQDLATGTHANVERSKVRELKRKVYNAYLRSTDDFTSSIFN